MFEDYNYNQFNRYILVDPNKEYESDDEAAEEKTEHEAVSVKHSKHGEPDCQDHAGRLSEKHLQASVTDSYKHNVLDDDTE